MATNAASIGLGLLRLVPGQDGNLFALYHEGQADPVLAGLPSFEINGQAREDFAFQETAGQRGLPHGGLETRLRFNSRGLPSVSLDVIIRSFASSPILRFKYSLSSGEPVCLTKPPGSDRDPIRWFSLHQAGFQDCTLTEYQLSHFDPVQHSYMPNREDRHPGEILPGLCFAGPIALFHTPRRTLLAAYEHGADHPFSFFDFETAGEASQRTVILRPRRGTIYNGQLVSAERPFESVWFELGLHPGSLDDFLPLYRRFFLEEVCENRESRKPYIFYNTWNYQERQKYFKGRPYLESMTAERMLAEIDAAHRLGVEVFVIDTGWYIKTGDWLPNLERFPEGLKEIRRRLDKYGMKLGLWFNPTVAALTSRVYLEHPEWEMTWEGKPSARHPIWETEISTGMCLASDYASYYASVMVRLNQELGVSYFKWDGVQQFGCDSPLHNHGTEANTPQERRESYAYQMGISMIRIVEEVTRRCPDVIVDFDITEGGRFVGLGFLSAGKYFLVNNGPYFHEFDIPRTVKIEPDTINVFFYPGPARPRICRQGIKYDELIPSILFLTHYLPDPPRLSQANSLAALVLGGSGWWGDLPALGEADLDYLGGQIALYKQVRVYATRAFPRRRGFAGSSPEIYEKIDPAAAGGLAAFFTVTPGTMIHYTQPLNLDNLGQVIGADAWEIAHGGRLKLTVTLGRDDARVVYLIPRRHS